MFLTASPLMGRWIVASCEIYVGIAELLLMAVVGQEVKVCNNNTSLKNPSASKDSCIITVHLYIRFKEYKNRLTDMFSFLTGKRAHSCSLGTCFPNLLGTQTHLYLQSFAPGIILCRQYL